MTCRKFHTLTSHGSLMAFIYKVIMANTVLYLLLQPLLMSASKGSIFTCGYFCPTHWVHTLIQVCALAKCKAASIYADSRHAFRLANDFRILCKQWRAVIHGVAKSRTQLRDWSDVIWSECNSLTSSGNRIKNVPMFRSYWMQYLLC